MNTFAKLLSAFLVASLTIALLNVAFADKIQRGVTVDEDKENCSWDVPEEIEYSADFIAVRRNLKVDDGKKFRVKAFVRNTGNTPWFSGESTCKGSIMSLGTTREQDRESALFIEGENWESKNRIGMDQLRVEPGEIASFTFYAEVEDDDVLKEYFAPVISGVTWLEDAEFGFDIVAGEPDEDKTAIRKKLLFAGYSGSVLDMNLNGEKVIAIDLSKQEAEIKLDGKLVNKFRVSTGAAHTPTPVGNYDISLKQEIRIGGAAPHYVMPKFMWFRAGGYGLHALPSLGTDGGYFWTEARDHIGTPVSHGCIRMLPEDADFTFEFADLGTKVVVER